MNIRIDRDLPVSLSQQLRGQIEYGIACGELPASHQLPSVRDLADDLGIAAVTVSQVYKELQQSGLLETFHGRGTFVTSSGVQIGAGQERVLELQRQIDRLIGIAEVNGVSKAELSNMVNARLGQRILSRPLRLVFVGVFLEATRSYVTDLRPMLAPTDTLEAVTLAQLENDAKVLKAVRRADLVVVIANRRAQVQAVLGGKVALVAVNFIPSERTRTALAELGPRTRLGVLSTFPEFLPTMKSGVERFASHLDAPAVAVLSDRAAVERLTRVCDVIVFATGSERVLEGLPEHVRALEYRHVPDPRSTERDVLPVVERIRAQKPAQKTVPLEPAPNARGAKSPARSRPHNSRPHKETA